MIVISGASEKLLTDLLGKYLARQAKEGAKLRLWSLIVTIFGDAIEPRGGVLRLGALQQITGHIGIENNALRTAMSRLASDGWLERERIGRASYYRPSQMASHKNNLADRLIYNSYPKDWDGKWIFAISCDGEDFDVELKAILHQMGFAFHSKKLAVAPKLPNFELDEKSDRNLNGIVFFDTQLTNEEANEQYICSSNNQKFISMLANVSFFQECQSLYTEFAGSSQLLLEDLNNYGTPDGLDALLLRTLLVHQWRRIVLKDVYWPRKLRTNDWPGFLAQSLISNLYHQLLEPSEAWLSTLDGTPEGKLPEAKINLAGRFCY